MSWLRASNGEVYSYEPPQQADLSVTDWLDDELAREEHRHGMGYGDDADHCDECAAEARLRLQAKCEHENVRRVDITRLATGVRWLNTCQDCGLTLSEEASVILW